MSTPGFSPTAPAGPPTPSVPTAPAEEKAKATPPSYAILRVDEDGDQTTYEVVELNGKPLVISITGGPEKAELEASRKLAKDDDPEVKGQRYAPGHFKAVANRQWEASDGTNIRVKNEPTLDIG